MSGCPMLQCLKGFGVKRGLSDGLYKLDIFHFIEVYPRQGGHGFPFYRGPCWGGRRPRSYAYKMGTHDVPTKIWLNSQGFYLWMLFEARQPGGFDLLRRQPNFQHSQDVKTSFVYHSNLALCLRMSFIVSCSPFRTNSWQLVSPARNLSLFAPKAWASGGTLCHVWIRHTCD